MPRQNRTLQVGIRELLSSVGDGAPSVEDKLRFLTEVRAHSPESVLELDRFFVEETDRLRGSLLAVKESQERLKQLHEKLTSPPWHEATYQGKLETSLGPKALVLHGHARRVVSVIDELDPASLKVGDTVFLSEGLNVILARSTAPAAGETACFDRLLPDGRMVIKSRDEELVVQIAEALLDKGLKAGDLIRFERPAMMAYEKIERTQESGLFLEQTPAETFDEIGGLDSKIRKLRESILLQIRHPEIVRKYRIRRVGSILLVGPPGTGKTLIARGLANWLATLSPGGRSRFMNIKPGALQSVWYSQSEANIREAFRVAREAGDRDPGAPVIMFFDEIDAIGAAREQFSHRADRGVLLALGAELNGLETRGNIIVVAATNRRDALDPALDRAGRLGDMVIEVPRPDRQAARDILAKHLFNDIPYAQNGHGGDLAATREEILDAAISRLYSPNGDGDLATILFRDGKRRAVRAPDLLSGAALANIARASTERAGQRDAQTGEAGLVLEDVLLSASEELEKAARVLTRANCRNYITDLPQDMDVVAVEPVVRKVARPHRFLSIP